LSPRARVDHGALIVGEGLCPAKKTHPKGSADTSTIGFVGAKAAEPQLRGSVSIDALKRINDIDVVRLDSGGDDADPDESI
jgi:hypothetical protein